MLGIGFKGDKNMTTMRIRIVPANRAMAIAVLISVLIRAGIASAEPATAADPDAAARVQAAAKAAVAALEEKKSKFKPFAEVTKDCKKYDGLFDLYRKDDHLFAVINSGQFDKPFLAPMAIARGIASAGVPLNFGDEWVIQFHRAGEKVQLVRKNIHYEAPKGSPLEKAVEQNYLDSVLMAVPVLSDDPPGGGVLIDFSEIFLSDFANMRLGGLDRSRTTWDEIKTFDNNVELQVKATYTSGGRGGYSTFWDDGVIDPRGITVVLHYSLTKPPEPGYKPRLADQRVGFFLNATKDFGSKDPDTNFTRRINRWRLEKANPSAKLSPPKKQITWWVENNVPHEYRPFVEEGILEWNKAFEKIGFRNAIGVRWQQDGDKFDPEDINYCTFRWITTPFTYAMSGLRADPITGEMIDGDVVFDASWIRYWQMEYAFLVGTPIPTGASDADANATANSIAMPLNVGEVISPIMAAKHGYGLPLPAPGRERYALQKLDDHSSHEHDMVPLVVPSSWSPIQVMMHQRLAEGRLCTCQYALAKQQEFRLAAIAMAANLAGDKDDGDKDKGGKEKDGKDKDGTDKDGKDKDKKDSIELPEELIGQLIKEVVMHEVGHSLGLRHNFKASSMLKLDQLNDKSITQKKGISGSVMDYIPVNISPDQSKQGDFASTTIGPYDYWAIEYAYKSIEGDEKKELQKIAARSPEADLKYATDEDLWMSNDPRVQAFDLGDDPLAFGKQRVDLAEKLLPKLDDKVVRDGESWARLRSAFSLLLAQYGNAAYLASSCIAGQDFAKHHKGKNTDDPIVPLTGEKQRAALKFVSDKILSDKAFKFSPQLLRRLSMDNWYHWGSATYFFDSIDYPIYDRVLDIQRIGLDYCLDPSVLTRLQNQKLLAKDDKPLEMSEIFRMLTDSIWSELKAKDENSEKLEISLIRRNLQREHLRKLSKIVVEQRRNPMYDLYDYVSFFGGSQSYPADARSLARMHVREIDKVVDERLKAKDQKMDDATRAHLEEIHEQIAKVLEAKISDSGP
jgi:hypothetical protein